MEAKVSRFEFIQPWEDQWGYRHNAQMADADDGEFVWYSDYAALEDERDRLERQRDTVNERWRERGERMAELLSLIQDGKYVNPVALCRFTDELKAIPSPENVTKASDLVNKPTTG